MQHAVLIRREQTKNTTRGELYVQGRRFVIIERAWKNNQKNESCIPTGKYKVVFLPRSASGKYKNCWHVLDVKNRSGILIHQGNIYTHSKGCLIIGKRRGVLSGLLATLNSRVALRELAKIMHKKSFYLTIYNGANHG